MRKKKQQIKIAVIDFETDPFMYGREPEPFAAGFYDGETYIDFWGDDCADQLMSYLASLPPMLIYAHNGGKFDFFFLLDHLDNPVFMINGRIVECKMAGHTFRDSYSILPMPLSAYMKDEIDYLLFERETRDAHRAEILKYLKSDCIYLHRLVTAFAERFTPTGKRLPPLTVGSTALRELRRIHPQKLDSSENHDSTFRAFYFGGRVQCFERGVIKGKWKIYDVNSMYPAVMSQYQHPFGTKYVNPASVAFNENGDIIGFEGCVFFICFSGVSNGHVPYRNEKGGIDFQEYSGQLHLVSHEFKAAYVRGMLEISEIHDIKICIHSQTFTEFVEKYAEEKKTAKLTGNDIAELFSKLIMNSSYGKFSQNPRKFRDYYIEKYGVDLAPENEPDLPVWRVTGSGEGYRIWERPIDELKFNDVAIAASITSAARAVLMAALFSAKRPIYCDTDSIICEEIGAGVPIHDADLGAWKFEGEGDTAIIGGKKMYAITREKGDWYKPYAEKAVKRGKKIEITRDGAVTIKKASKGVRLSIDQLRDLADGDEITHKIDAPAFNLKRGVKFTERRVRATK